MMKLHEFESHLPPKFWVAVVEEDPYKFIDENFTVFDIEDFPDMTENHNLKEHFNSFNDTEISETFPVMNKKTGKLGVLVIVYDTARVTESVVPHEAVHVADYYYEYIGQDKETFSEGNENYAYLVGWASKNIHKALKEYRNGKQRKTR